MWADWYVHGHWWTGGHVQANCLQINGSRRWRAEISNGIPSITFTCQREELFCAVDGISGTG